MSINLSIKNVPDAMAKRLRARAERNHRSLQGELMAILEAAAKQDLAAAAHGTARTDTLSAAAPVTPRVATVRDSADRAARAATMGLDQVVERARRRFPEGTAQFGRSVDIIREMRDERHAHRR